MWRTIRGYISSIIIFLCLTLLIGLLAEPQVQHAIDGLQPPQSGSVPSLSHSPLRVPTGRRGVIPAPPADFTNPKRAEWYMRWLAYDAKRTWNAYLAASGFHVAAPDIRFVERGQKTHSDCFSWDGSLPGFSKPGVDDLAEFCANNGEYGTIWLPVEPLISFWKTTGQAPYAVQEVVDHEYGHFIQFWLELTNQWASVPDPVKPNVELIATCFSGAMGNAMYYENGAYTLDQAETDLSSLPYDAAHGTAVQEARAYAVGFAYGRPTDCAKTYWPHAHF